MMVEKSGGRAKSTRMLTVQCTICGMDMDCPESMLSAQRHFCARCTDLLAEGYEPEDLVREFYMHGARSGMPAPMLDDVMEAVRGAKRGMGEGK